MILGLFVLNFVGARSLFVCVVLILMAYLRNWDEQSNGWEEWDQASPYESPWESECDCSDSDCSSTNQGLESPHSVDPLPGHVMRRAQAVFYRRPKHVWLFENLRPFLLGRYGIGGEWWRNLMDCLIWTPSMRCLCGRTHYGCRCRDG